MSKISELQLAVTEMLRDAMVELYSPELRCSYLDNVVNVNGKGNYMYMANHPSSSLGYDHTFSVAVRLHNKISIGPIHRSEQIVDAFKMANNDDIFVCATIQLCFSGQYVHSLVCNLVVVNLICEDFQNILATKIYNVFKQFALTKRIVDRC